MPIVLYGIPACSSVKKARQWLDERGVAYQFHDYKKQGVPEASLRRWVATKGWPTLLNRQGTTWRKLDDATKAAVIDADRAIAVMLAHPSTIKRPVIEASRALIVGFDAEALESLARGS